MLYLELSYFGANMFIQNIKSGVTVALVSIPLSISLALASGVSPTAGIITAIWAGLIGALLGGSNYNIIGPTGALSGFIASFALTSGPHAVPLLSICVGLFILLAYMLKLETYIVLIPSSVIHGFTLGVACIIAKSQLQYACATPFDLGISILFLVILMLIQKYKITIPGIILITPIGLVLGWLSLLKTIGTQFGVISSKIISFDFALTTFPVIPALVIAVVAILETLLSAKIADGITHTHHDSRAEIFGLGCANIISGLLGGIPATAALARTSLNVRSGARSRYSAIVNSIVIALISVLFLPYFSYMPVSVIAAILLSVAFHMIEREHFISLFKYDKPSFIIALIVAGVTVYDDPIIGIIIGICLALFLLVKKLLPGYAAVRSTDGILIYSLKGEFVYLNSDAQREKFEQASKKYQFIILKLRDLNFIDFDGAVMFDEMLQNALHLHKTVVLAHVDEKNYQLLHNISKSFKQLEKQGLIFADTHAAIQKLKKDKSI